MGLFSLAHLGMNLDYLFWHLPKIIPDLPVLQARRTWHVDPADESGPAPRVPCALAGSRDRGCSPAAFVFTLIPSLLYYGGGWLQFGYRYALDAIPFAIALCAMAVAWRGGMGWGWRGADRLRRARQRGRGLLGLSHLSGAGDRADPADVLALATISGPGAILALVTSPTLDAEPACPGAPLTAGAGTSREAGARPFRGSATDPLVAVRRRFDEIPRDAWDGLAAATPSATPFSAWAFHRSWWDAYSATAHEHTLVVVDPADATDPGARPRAIVPLMHRHEVEPIDVATHTTMRHAHGAELTPVAPTAKAVFFGASYHADYATVLAAPADLPAVAEALVASPRGRPGRARRRRPLGRRGPPAAPLRRPCRRRARPARSGALPRLRLVGHDRARGRLPGGDAWRRGIDFDAQLGTLGKKERHEIRRKIRRAEAAGEIAPHDFRQPALATSTPSSTCTRSAGAPKACSRRPPGGDCSRRFFRHLFRHFGPDGPAKLTRLTIGGRLVASGIHFDDGERIPYYNAGVDPDARDLSPGVVMVAEYLQHAIAAGRREVDFLRGNEPYKYEWGAVDQPIQRILVTRPTRQS